MYLFGEIIRMHNGYILLKSRISAKPTKRFDYIAYVNIRASRQIETTRKLNSPEYDTVNF